MPGVLTNRDIDRALCYFRNLVYTTYREARHLGTFGRHADYVAEEPHCKLAKQREKDGFFRSLHNEVLGEVDVERVVKPFREATGLSLHDLPIIFGSEAKWHGSYGGSRWQCIAERTVHLRNAIAKEDWRLANELCDEVRTLRHNSGALVDPSKPYKWPVDCDASPYMNS